MQPHQNPPRTFSPRVLRALRTDMKWTQEETARKAHIPLCTYQAYEHGRVRPSVDRLTALAELFAVSVDTLIPQETK